MDRKLIQPARIETVDSGFPISKRLHIRDISLSIIFLIDTRSDISLLPADSKTLKLKPSNLTLFAANDTHVLTYGERRLSLNLNLRREFSWNFCTAAVPSAIIGADFLAHFRLVPFLHESSLVDTVIEQKSKGFLKHAPSFGLSLIDRSASFYSILADFPEITSIPQYDKSLVGGVQHHILTNGPPFAERARRLSQDKLVAAKAIFKQMLKDGICRPSSSSWTSPIHLVRKKAGEWRVCGDFRRLKAITIPDKYPVPHLHYFISLMCGKTIFSKLDLHMVYQQIPIAPSDIPKTAVITPFGLWSL
ncbi:uncharacterized protein LOC117170972 [Belonocnema kinseyi]|uniref:uncharacterized protein LOC117170972 n=1 Tax=Belonocnema kinseyi TaxID=2817044 RepID=UPI00143E04CF|nr:uncharacterized protein LOC117170972 [Belonocnema kinseyi]